MTDGILHKAISDGLIDEVQNLLKDGADIDKLFGSRGTPLCAAISANQPRIVELLLQSGCDVNKGDTDNEPPICLAVRKANVDIVKLLLGKTECNVNTIDPVSGQTPIHLAIINGSISIIEMILNSRRCLYNGGNKLNETPVTLAVRQCNIEAVKLLIGAGCALNIADQQGDLPIHVAAMLPNAEMLELLLAHAGTSETVDSLSKDNGNKKVMKEGENIKESVVALDATKKEHLNPMSSLGKKEGKQKSKTADKEDVEIEMSLYDDAISQDVNQGDLDNLSSESSTLVHSQMADLPSHQIRDEDTIQNAEHQVSEDTHHSHLHDNTTRISDESDNTTEDESDLLSDVDSEFEEMLDYFWGPKEENELEDQETVDQEGSWNVNSSNIVGMRLPLHIAVSNQLVDNVKCLIKHGAALNVADANGNTPLVYACVKGNLEIAKILLEAGADPNGSGQPVMLGFIIPGAKTTALYAAIDCKSEDIINLLIDHGANLNIPSGEFSKQPLISYCLCKGRMDLALKFLEYVPERLDLTATDRDGHNCLFPAIKCDESDEEFIEKLISLGVSVNQPNRAMEYPVESCVSLERPDLIETLLKHGSYLNKPDEDGCTALHIAVMQGDLYCTSVLMQYGADMRFGPTKYESVVTIAFEYYNVDMAFQFISEGYRAGLDCIRLVKKKKKGRIIPDCFVEDKKLLKKFAQAALVPTSLTVISRNTIRDHFIDNDLVYSNIYKLQAPGKLLDFISMKTNVWNEE